MRVTVVRLMKTDSLPESGYTLYVQQKEALETLSPCQEYTGELDAYGYGVVHVMVSSKNWVYVKAHRLSYALHNGEDPGGKIVRHKCDNPPCVNPEHLLLGTNKDNVADRDKRNRTSKGTSRPLSKLTDDKVRWLRSQREAGVGLKVIASELGVNHSTVSLASSRKTWKHVED